MAEFISNSVLETEQIAEKLAKTLKSGDIIAYRGGLGAGKTAFTRGLALGLGIFCDVTSPTFSLLHEYRGENAVLYHFDMYRVMGFESLCSTGFFDCLASDGVLAVEWSENISEEIPESAFFVTISQTGENSRRIVIERGLSREPACD